MKTKNLLWSLLITLLVTGFSACSTDEPEDPNKGTGTTDPETETLTYTIDFEDVELGENGYWNGSDLSGEVKTEESWGETITKYYGGFSSEIANFSNIYTAEWYSWSGFACSNHVDAQTEGFGNQYSVMAAKGANNSKQFAIANSDGATFECPQNEHGYFTIESIMLTNSTYAYFSMKNGDSYGKIFSSEDKDWFKVTITGYKGEKETGTVDYYLADFRDGKAFISNTWEKVDVSSLAEVDKVTFSFSSSDMGEYGMNTPAYVCIDNILFTQEIEK